MMARSVAAAAGGEGLDPVAEGGHGCVAGQHGFAASLFQLRGANGAGGAGQGMGGAAEPLGIPGLGGGGDSGGQQVDVFVEDRQDQPDFTQTQVLYQLRNERPLLHGLSRVAGAAGPTWW